MKTKYVATAFASVLALAGLGGSIQPAAAQSGVAAGALTCDVASGWGFIFGSSKDLKCTYSNGSSNEHYTGAITKFGVDIGYTQSAVIVWAVVAPTANVAKGALTGTYVGATGQATVGGGVGANVLVGGGNSVSLQPVSFSGQTGLNVAGGIAGITLKAAN
ncbi:MAG TPA: DUF992 domain-containing protein [Stellaceae bacterium]|nr:DUF992 domain-containing protein [Stellaceae bacterium]